MSPSSLPDFVPPSPGAWELEQTHVTRPVSPYTAEIFPGGVQRGFTDGTRNYGSLVEYIDLCVVNGFLYSTIRAVAAPKNATGLPPKPLFKAMRWLHPEFRRRVARSERIWDERPWRDEVRQWREEVKPGIASRARAFLAEDLSGMTDAQLVDFLQRTKAFAHETIYWHHRFNMCAMIPLGDFLAHVMDWTGLPPTEILKVVRGLSPASAGAVDELAAVRAALRADAEAMMLLLGSSAPATIVDGLAARPGAAGDAVRAYLDLVGLRIIGAYDPCERHAREQPELLVKILRTAVTGDPVTMEATATQAVSTLRAKIPAGHQARFDALLEEVRATFAIRDERALHGDAVGSGVARCGLLEAGRRLTARGLLRDPQHAVNATVDELASLLVGGVGPSADVVAERHRYRLETPLSAAPQFIGIPPFPPPPAEWLSGGARRLHRATMLVLDLMFQTRKGDAAPAGARALKGFGVSPGIYEGPARVIRRLEELETVQQGEVLVTASTSPTFNVVLPLVGAIVTERGGALCHAAIVAREFGLPGVVGCPGALDAISTGTRVRVDGATGDVQVLR